MGELQNSYGRERERNKQTEKQTKTVISRNVLPERMLVFLDLTKESSDNAIR
jgi:hypothetical protein